MEVVDNGVNLRRKKSWIYGLIVGFIFVGFFVFFTSKLYLPYEEPVYHTELKKSVALFGNRTMTIEKRAYDPASHTIEMFLHVEGGDGEHYQFQAQEKANPNLQLPVKVVYQDDKNLVVQVKELSSKWQAVALDVFEKNNRDVTVETKQKNEGENETSKEDDKQTFLKSFFSDQKKTEIEEGISQKSKGAYAKVFIGMEQKILKEKVKQYDEVMKQETSKQTEWQKQITEWKNDSKYQTETEKMETDAKINSKETNISQSKEKVELYKWEQGQVKEKIKKLDEKAKDIERS
ncbi:MULTISPECIES: hypothetical protein [Bacillus]|uniref:Uncharacterized protein n=3 Tax=Bacillus pseudomycoides TaxID=64104 RepID=A0AAJ2DLP2_9BACI|nr:hypothetical protein [Bacillus pseudomycoides]EEM02392.1 hypothetical protein bmyco0002_52560 [Bacillus pseudomycoides]EEM10634.1 hypothetical protein bmyco0003_26370 [Bacillus pseudomycoides]MCR8860682.1 hypothetical protein [Bacillus pseudomycoides]MDR4328210.1 hypothetical protein [Bacillus pseudomycoides]MED1534522.1 hypothetical protein [Bacillus pseudomycoides]